jgi:hypothetical protein
MQMPSTNAIPMRTGVLARRPSASNGTAAKSGAVVENGERQRDHRHGAAEK